MDRVRQAPAARPAPAGRAPPARRPQATPHRPPEAGRAAPNGRSGNPPSCGSSSTPRHTAGRAGVLAIIGGVSAHGGQAFHQFARTFVSALASRDRAVVPFVVGAIMKRRQFLAVVGVGLATALSAISRSGRAQSYPSRPIRLVVPFPPGGAFDTLGRPFGDKLKSLLGTIVIENIGGSGSSLGASAVAHAPPDGYTILLGGTLPHVNEALLKSRPLYDPVKDLYPIASVAANFLCIAVHPAVPAQSLKELIDYAKANPGKLSYGHAGVGSIQHLTGELFKSLAGTPEIVQVPYRGTGPVITDLIGGQIPMGTPGVTGQVLELHRSGKLRVLAVTSPARLIAAPELPTAAELGFPGMTVTGSIW